MGFFAGFWKDETTWILIELNILFFLLFSTQEKLGKSFRILFPLPAKNSWSFSLSDKIILKPTFDVGFFVYFRESTLVKLICYIFPVWRVVVKVHKLPAITGVL